MLATPIWNALREFDLKTYDDCWFVPQRLYKLREEYICSVDILREVKIKRLINN